MKQKWFHMTLKELFSLEDEESAKEFARFYHGRFQKLLSKVEDQGAFTFSKPLETLTPEDMMKEVLMYYQKIGVSKEEVKKLLSEHDD